MIKAVIGANLGDEGKGLAVNYLSKEGKNLVVRHNGGAQSGHTVETDGKKFVFHELSSGSFNDADTYWDYTYHPDLYTLGKEYDAFYSLTGKAPIIYCHKDAQITLIDDILLNCFKETYDKAGSCGMGIWECVCRVHYGHRINIKDIQKNDINYFYSRLKLIRNDYSVPKLLEYADKYHASNDTYADMLFSDTTLFNYAVEVKHNIDRIRIVNGLGELFDKYDNIIFENGQGLLIDGDYDKNHGTPSKTGLYNVKSCLRYYGKQLDEAIYVTRTYLTRHGVGNFVDETSIGYYDDTNIYNQWQGNMRYGKFDSIDNLVCRIKNDCPEIEPHILVTHANLTSGKLLTSKGDVDITTLPFEKIYVSENRFDAHVI